jgi:hypothetical protein
VRWRYSSQQCDGYTPRRARCYMHASRRRRQPRHRRRPGYLSPGNRGRRLPGVERGGQGRPKSGYIVHGGECWWRSPRECGQLWGCGVRGDMGSANMWRRRTDQIGGSASCDGRRQRPARTERDLAPVGAGYRALGLAWVGWPELVVIQSSTGVGVRAPTIAGPRAAVQGAGGHG